MKWDMLTRSWAQTTAPIPTKPSSSPPNSSRGTNTTTDRPPTQRRSMIGESIAAGRGGRAAAVGAVMAGKKAGDLELATKMVFGVSRAPDLNVILSAEPDPIEGHSTRPRGLDPLSCRFVSHVREASNKLTQPGLSASRNALPDKQIPGLVVWHDSRNCWLRNSHLEVPACPTGRDFRRQGVCPTPHRGIRV